MTIFADGLEEVANGEAVPSRPLIIAASLQLALQGCVLIGAISAIGFNAALGWRGTLIALLIYGAIAARVLSGLSRHQPHSRFGLANIVTLARAALTAFLLGVVGEMLLGGALVLGDAMRWILAISAAVALALDGLDGWLARRSGMASAFGERFDIETDALFLLSLTLLVYLTGNVGLWVLASGLMYYAFLLAGRLWPLFAAPLPPKMRRKTICVAQGALIIAAIAPIIPPQGAQMLCLIGLGLLVYSFGIDAIWLIRRAGD